MNLDLSHTLALDAGFSLADIYIDGYHCCLEAKDKHSHRDDLDHPTSPQDRPSIFVPSPLSYVLHYSHRPLFTVDIT